MTTTNDARPVVIDHPIGSHGRLAIRLGAAELRLAATDGDHVVVRTPSGAHIPDRVILDTVDGSLTIREKDILGLTISLGRRVVQLEIDVPAAAEIAVDTASGWLDAQGLRGEQRYRTASAETRLRAGAGRIELNTVSGDATIELAGSADLAVRSVSGDLTVAGGRLDSLRISTTSGDIRLDSPLAARTGNTIETLSGDVSILATTGMRVEARTVSGDLASDLPHRSEGRSGRRTLIVGDGSVELAFRSVSGDLRIHDGSGRSGPDRPRAPRLPSPPAPPSAPRLPERPQTAPTGADAGDAGTDADDPAEAQRMAILRALESGELDVPTAMDRLAALDASGHGEQEHADA